MNNINKKQRTAMTWQKIFTWMLLANAMYILIFYLIMRFFN